MVEVYFWFGAEYSFCEFPKWESFVEPFATTFAAGTRLCQPERYELYQAFYYVAEAAITAWPGGGNRLALGINPSARVRVPAVAWK